MNVKKTHEKEISAWHFIDFDLIQQQEICGWQRPV